MPQLNLLKPADDLMGCRVTWSYPDYQPDAPLMSEVQLRRRNGDWYTLISHVWQGIEADFMVTYVSDITIAWAFSDSRAVLGAAVSTHRAARAHRREHENE